MSNKGLQRETQGQEQTLTVTDPVEERREDNVKRRKHKTKSKETGSGNISEKCGDRNAEALEGVILSQGTAWGPTAEEKSIRITMVESRESLTAGAQLCTSSSSIGDSFINEIIESPFEIKCVSEVKCSDHFCNTNPTNQSTSTEDLHPHINTPLPQSPAAENQKRNNGIAGNEAVDSIMDEAAVSAQIIEEKSREEGQIKRDWRTCF